MFENIGFSLMIDTDCVINILGPVYFVSLNSIIVFFTLFLKVFCLHGRFPITAAGNWFQSWMVLFTNEYFPISVLCFKPLISPCLSLRMMVVFSTSAVGGVHNFRMWRSSPWTVCHASSSSSTKHTSSIPSPLGSFGLSTFSGVFCQGATTPP